MTDQTVHGVLGVGSLGEAIVHGLLRAAPASRIVLSPRGARRSAALAARQPDVIVATDNQGVVDASDVVIVCLRAADAAILQDLRFRADQVVVSAVAGLSQTDLAAWVAPASKVARSVPLVAVAEHAWATPVQPPLPEAIALFDRIGGSLALDSPEQFDAVITGLGTVGGFFDYLSVVEAHLVGHGVDDEDARRLVAQLFVQVVRPLGEVEVPDFAEERRRHATPGGLNEQLVEVLHAAGVPELVRQGLDEIHRRQTSG